MQLYLQSFQYIAHTNLVYVREPSRIMYVHLTQFELVFPITRSLFAIIRLQWQWFDQSHAQTYRHFYAIAFVSQYECGRPRIAALRFAFIGTNYLTSQVGNKLVTTYTDRHWHVARRCDAIMVLYKAPHSNHPPIVVASFASTRRSVWLSTARHERASWNMYAHARIGPIHIICIYKCIIYMYACNVRSLPHSCTPMQCDSCRTERHTCEPHLARVQFDEDLSDVGVVASSWRRAHSHLWAGIV